MKQVGILLINTAKLISGYKNDYPGSPISSKTPKIKTFKNYFENLSNQIYTFFIGATSKKVFMQSGYDASSRLNLSQAYYDRQGNVIFEKEVNCLEMFFICENYEMVRFLLTEFQKLKNSDTRFQITQKFFEVLVQVDGMQEHIEKFLMQDHNVHQLLNLDLSSIESDALKGLQKLYKGYPYKIINHNNDFLFKVDNHEFKLSDVHSRYLLMSAISSPKIPFLLSIKSKKFELRDHQAERLRDDQGELLRIFKAAKIREFQKENIEKTNFEKLYNCSTYIPEVSIANHARSFIRNSVIDGPNHFCVEDIYKSNYENFELADEKNARQSIFKMNILKRSLAYIPVLYTFFALIYTACIASNLYTFIAINMFCHALINDYILLLNSNPKINSELDYISYKKQHTSSSVFKFLYDSVFTIVFGFSCSRILSVFNILHLSQIWVISFGLITKYSEIAIDVFVSFKQGTYLPSKILDKELNYLSIFCNFFKNLSDNCSLIVEYTKQNRSSFTFSVMSTAIGCVCPLPSARFAFYVGMVSAHAIHNCLHDKSNSLKMS